ncbi:hypothetical protein BC831DRAFT_454371 [Entophlyctis helioformis]|nr:hypothetical protein BC831DRAFT_454371 [Entophlyctis helioformis]
MAGIVPTLGAPSSYRDRKYEGGLEQLEIDLGVSSTLYVGNLSFYTTEEQIYELFSKCGEIKRIIMGLDRNKKTPCGFCFVEFYRRNDALDCMQFLNGTKLDERFIRTDIDPGFKPGRQYGRGQSGGQVRDEHRADYDEARGGWGARMREEQMRDVYDSAGSSLANVPDGTSDFYTKSYIDARATSGASDSEGPSGTKAKRGRDSDDDEDAERDGARGAGSEGPRRIARLRGRSPAQADN